MKGREFGALLARLREEAGYKSPRAFYDAQGGRESFGCTLKAYTDAERGRTVPSPTQAERIAAGLRVGLDAEAGPEFARTYLRALFGGDDFLEFAAWALRRDAPAHGMGALAHGMGAPARRRRSAAGPVPGRAAEAVLDHPFLLRASEAELLDYAPVLERALGDAAAGGPSGPDANDYVLEVRVTRLLPF